MLAIDAKGIKKTYASGTEALRGVDIAVEQGEFFGLLGANGAGKTTLIGILSGLVTKSAGEGSVFGYDIDGQRDLAKAQIGVVPQEFNFSIFEKVWDIVLTQAGYYGLRRDQAAPRAEELLKALGLWEKRNQASRTLSGGMKRRLMIARALVHDPKLLILDEPTAGVDVELRYGMWEYLTNLNARGTTILLTTHYLEEAERLCRTVAIINNGNIVKRGSVAKLLQGLDMRSYIVTLDSTAGLDGISEFAFRMTDDTTAEVTLTREQSVTDVADILKKSGRIITDIRQQENRLERLFLDTIKG